VVLLLGDTTARSAPEPGQGYGDYGEVGSRGTTSEPAPSMNYQYGAPSQPEAPPAPQPQMHQMQQQQQQRPAAVTGHNRQSSGFDSGFVMGGSAPPIPQPAAQEQGSISSAARAHSSSGDYGFEDEEAYKIVEEMKKKAERAAEAARDAEAASRKLAPKLTPGLYGQLPMKRKRGVSVVERKRHYNAMPTGPLKMPRRSKRDSWQSRHRLTMQRHWLQKRGGRRIG